MTEEYKQKRYELYCALVAFLATSKDANKLIDLLEEKGWQPL